MSMLLSSRRKKEIKKVLGVIDSLHEQLRYIEHLPTYISSFPTLMNESLSSDGKESIKSFYESERVFDRNMNKETRIKCVKSIKRALHHLQKVELPKNDKKSRTIQLFVETMNNYKNIIKEKLNLSLEELNSLHRQRNQLLLETKKADADIRAFSSALLFEQQIHKNEMNQKEADIKKLRNKLSQVKMSAKSEKRDFDVELIHASGNEKSLFKNSRKSLIDNIKKLTKELNEIKLSNKKLEGDMKVMRKNIESKLNATIENYKELMFNSSKEIKEYVIGYEMDDRRIKFLTESITTLSVDRLEKKRIQVIRNKHLKFHLLKIHGFANARRVLLQSWRISKKKKRNRKKKTVEEQEQDEPLVLEGVASIKSK